LTVNALFGRLFNALEKIGRGGARGDGASAIAKSVSPRHNAPAISWR